VLKVLVFMRNLLKSEVDKGVVRCGNDKDGGYEKKQKCQHGGNIFKP
jgi:hypothetical protein